MIFIRWIRKKEKVVIGGARQIPDIFKCINDGKPNNFVNKDTECPFCDRKSLENIIDTEGPFIILKNKYPTIKDTCQLVIIESYECDTNMSKYSDEYMIELIRFSISTGLK